MNDAATMTRAPAGEKPRFKKDIPFDTDRLDALLDEAGIDVLIACSKHNIQYLIGGGYRFSFHEYNDAVAMSRYLPLLLYFKGRPERSTYIANRMEKWEDEIGSFWMPVIEPVAWGTTDAMQEAARHLKALGRAKLRIGVERAFLPADAEGVLRKALPDATIVDAVEPLERLRAVKSPAEIENMRQASTRVVESMMEVFAAHGPGSTKAEMVETLRQEEVKRGLVFEYCLTTAGSSLNRVPSAQVWRKGEPLSLDSGGTYGGYIGDLCRMAVAGEPDAELEDLLAEVDAIQQATRKPIRAGVMGGELPAAALAVIQESPNRDYVDFATHGVGLILHEAPRLIGGVPFPYEAVDAKRPLEAGMVVSIETAIKHPRRGFIKLEDTLAVTKTGWEAFGDFGRGWNRAGKQ
ncbi:MAG: M24 family metallopeptidase [Propylenella sp.]